MVGREHIAHACDCRAPRSETKGTRFASPMSRRNGSLNAGNRFGSRLHVADVVDVQPLEREVAQPTRRAPVARHPECLSPQRLRPPPACQQPRRPRAACLVRPWLQRNSRAARPVPGRSEGTRRPAPHPAGALHRAEQKSGPTSTAATTCSIPHRIRLPLRLLRTARSAAHGTASRESISGIR